MGVGELYLAALHNIAHAARLFIFRSYGALTAGELLRLIMSFLTPLMLVFAGLTLAFNAVQP